MVGPKEEDRLDKLQETNAAFITQLSNMVLTESDPQICLIFANTILTQRYFEDILGAVKEQGDNSMALYFHQDPFRSPFRALFGPLYD